MRHRPGARAARRRFRNTVVLVGSITMTTIAACSAGDGSTTSLPPLTTLGPGVWTIVDPTSTVAGAPTTAVGGTTTTAPLPNVPASTLVPPSTTTSPAATTTIVAATTTTAGATTPPGDDPDGWIMQLASTDASTAQTAIDAQVTAFERLTGSDVQTLRTDDFPDSFTGPPRIVFYVDGFDSREAVIAECGRLELVYPDNCLGRTVNG